MIPTSFLTYRVTLSAAKRLAQDYFQEMAEWTGLEPATPGVTGRYSNQLNYHSAVGGC
jgi:hypothetical protein